MSEPIVTPVPAVMQANWASLTEMVGTIHDNSLTGRPSDPSGACFEHRLVVGTIEATPDTDSIDVTIVQPWSINLGLITVEAPRIVLEGYAHAEGLDAAQVLALAAVLSDAAPQLGLIRASYAQNAGAL